MIVPSHGGCIIRQSARSDLGSCGGHIVLQVASRCYRVVHRVRGVGRLCEGVREKEKQEEKLADYAESENELLKCI